MSAKIIKGNFVNAIIKTGEKYNHEYALLGYYAGTLAAVEQGKVLGVVLSKNNPYIKATIKCLEGIRINLNISPIKISANNLLPYQDVIENNENKMYYMYGGTISLYYGILKLFVGFVEAIEEEKDTIPKEEKTFLNTQKKMLLEMIEELKTKCFDMTEEMGLDMFDLYIPILTKSEKNYLVRGAIDFYMLDIVIPYLKQNIESY